MTRSFLFAIGAAALLAASPARADDPAGPAGEVTTVSVVPTPGEAQILIAVRGSVDVKDYVLRDPDRLVIDILGARLNPGAAYDGVLRGGIDELVDRYGGVRALARVIGWSPAYISRLRIHVKNNPSPDVLQKFGLRRVVFYELISNEEKTCS